jgi:purine catabolism regulator
MLGSLIKYDNEKGTEYIKTLISYFKNSGNLKKVSEEMFTHYNTIIYRMQRIKEITGINFGDYDEILNLQIVLKIHELIKHNEIT